MLFHQKDWYVAALPQQISREPLRRVVLNEPIVFYRSEQGDPIALEDRCPYRFVAVGSAVEAGAVTRFTRIANPETCSSTHYFMSGTRNYSLDDATVDAQVISHMVGVISAEDSPMLEAIDREMQGADLFDKNPVMLPADAGGVRVRRVIARLIAAESRTGSRRAAERGQRCAAGHCGDRTLAAVRTGK